ncbi:MAG TPA: helix-hairpin-helix domain-containing protein [Anaerolineales bacterium]|nr:helix-hairpin-helix domain-containing protein [Anaerolineales bacterium]
MLDSIKHHWKPFLFGLCVGLLSVPLILVLNQRPTGTPIALLPPPPTITPVPLRVHVTGAVNAPGVYQLPKTSIVQDAIDAAGGFSENADVSGLNLAGLLIDGQKLFIPELPPTAPPTPTTGPGTPAPTPAAQTTQPPNNPTTNTGQLININTATQAELESLPRIGPAIAQRIIEYRTLNGPFTSIEQIKNVKGIGEATFNAIKDFITVK